MKTEIKVAIIGGVFAIMVGVTNSDSILDLFVGEPKPEEIPVTELQVELVNDKSPDNATYEMELRYNGKTFSFNQLGVHPIPVPDHGFISVVYWQKMESSTKNADGTFNQLGISINDEGSFDYEGQRILRIYCRVEQGDCDFNLH